MLRLAKYPSVGMRFDPADWALSSACEARRHGDGTIRRQQLQGAVAFTEKQRGAKSGEASWTGDQQ